jgi:hypothetical protein
LRLFLHPKNNEDQRPKALQRSQADKADPPTGTCESKTLAASPQIHVFLRQLFSVLESTVLQKYALQWIFYFFTVLVFFRTPPAGGRWLDAIWSKGRLSDTGRCCALAIAIGLSIKVDEKKQVAAQQSTSKVGSSVGTRTIASFGKDQESSEVRVDFWIVIMVQSGQQTVVDES